MRDWHRVPWVPASVLKSVALHAAPPVVTFRSSGTTAGERRSAHHHPFPHLYRRVIDCSFPDFLLQGRRPVPMLSLIPGFEPARESSLSFMVDHVLATFAADGSANVVGPDGIDHDRAGAWLADRERDRRPCLLLSTALALDQLLRGLDRSDLRPRPAPGKRALSHWRVQDAPRRAHARRPVGAARGPARARAHRGGPGVRNDRAHQPGLHALSCRRAERPLRVPALDARARARPDLARGGGRRRHRAPRRLRPRQRGVGAPPPHRGPRAHRRRWLPAPRPRLGRRAARLLAHRRGARDSGQVGQR